VGAFRRGAPYGFGDLQAKESPGFGVSTLPGFWSPTVIADLDTLLTALYVELTDRIIPRRRPTQAPMPWTSA